MVGQPIDRSKVFAERGATLFSSTVAVQDIAVQTAEGKSCVGATLWVPKSSSQDGVQCLWRKNSNVLATLRLLRRKESQGYSQKQPPVADIEKELGGVDPKAKACLSRWRADLMAEMRPPEKKQHRNCEAPKSSAEKTAAAESSKEPEHPPSVELDLNDVEDAEKFTLYNFSQSERSKVKPVAQFFFCKNSKNSKGKKQSLSETIRKELLWKKVLDSVSGRNAWLKAWASNRSQRYITVTL
eukprot:s180_g10.t1